MINAFDNLLKFIGAFMRWGAGYEFEIVLGLRNLAFDEVLNGPENKNESHRGISHRNANRFMGLLVIAPIVLAFLEGLGFI